jgi:uncharacterized phage protein gp47/JayE
MTVAFEALVTPVTREQMQESIYAVLAKVGVNTTSWKPGAVVRTIIVGVSIVLAAFSNLIVKIARSGFLELSDGDWLTLVAHYVYGVDRDEATFATGETTLTNAAGGVYSFDPGDLTFGNPTTHKTYRNTEGGTLAALSTLVIDIEATEAGAASTSVAGTITEMVTTLDGVSCSNDEAVIGDDAELDPALRARCSEKLGSLSPNGPWDAYAFAARNARRLDGTKVGISRVRINKDGFGNVFVYVATATGAVTGDADDDTTDLGAVNDAVQKKAAPLAVTANVLSAVDVALDITYEVWIYDTVAQTDAQIQTAIEARLVTFAQGQPIGGNVIAPDPGKIFLDAIRTAIGATFPGFIFHVEITLPADDLELALSEVAVLGTILCTAIHQTSPSEGSA